MNTFLFFYRNMNVGGCQLLIVNVAKEIIRQGDYAIVICEYIDEKIKKTMANVPCYEIGKKQWYSDRVLKKRLHSFVNANIITFLWEDYSRIYSTKLISQKLLFYAVHCDAVKFSAYSENKLLCYLRRAFLKPTINNIVLNKGLCLMDKQTIKHSEEYYGLNFDMAKIIHIPVESSDIDEEGVKEKYEKIILAVARADFPFKGYLLGLIESFNTGIIPTDFRIIIVSYGRDEDALKQSIAQLQPEKRKHIQLFGETPYTELRELYKKASLYIGMGTTILDASKYGVLSIPVVPFTNKLLCDHFFHNDPDWVAIDEGTEIQLGELIRQIGELTKDELYELGEKCKYIVKSMYSVKTCAEDLKTAFVDVIPIKDLRIVLSYKLRKIKACIQRCTKELVKR